MGASTSTLQEDSVEFHGVFVDLAKAARGNQSQKVQEILQTHTDVIPALLKNTDENGNTALAMACREGHLDVVQALVYAGSEVDQENYQQYTPLMQAAWGNHPHIIKFLLTAKANVNHQQSRFQGLTSLLICAEKGWSECADILLQSGASVSVTRLDGKTSFHIAATKGHVKIVHLLLRYGIDLGIKDNEENTALTLADAANHKIVSLLLSSQNPGADYAIERAVAVSSVIKACILCKKVFKALVSAETLSKKDKSPVTVADFGAQAVVIRQIRSGFPADKVVGEEDAAELRSEDGAELRNRVCDLVRSVESEFSDDEILAAIDFGTYEGGPTGRHWALDPIDGTLGFLRGEQYAVALSLIVDGEPIIGVLGCPNLPIRWGSDQEGRGVVFVAVKGQGAYMRRINDDEEISLRVSDCSDFSQVKFCESVEAAHTSHSDSEKIASLLNVTTAPIRMDSQCKYAALSRGDAEIYLRLPTKKGYEEKIWDHAAGALIIQEAGGKVTDVNGSKLDFSIGRTLRNNQGVVASNGLIHDRVIDVVKQVLGSKTENTASTEPRNSTRPNPITPNAKPSDAESPSSSSTITHEPSPTTRKNPIMESQPRSFNIPPSGRVNPIIAKARSETNLSTKVEQAPSSPTEPKEEIPAPVQTAPKAESAPQSREKVPEMKMSPVKKEDASNSNVSVRTGILQATRNTMLGSIVFVPQIVPMSVEFPQGIPTQNVVSEEEFMRSFDFYRRELREKQPILGNTHPTVIRFLFKLGDLLRDHKKYSQAGEYYFQLAQIWSESKSKGTILDPKNFDPNTLASSLDTVAFNCSESQDYPQALRLYEVTYLLINSIYGENNSITATVLENLAASYVRVNDTNSALHHFLKALEILTPLPDKSDEDIARLSHYIANMYSALEQHEEATKYFENGKTIYSALGAEHEENLITLLEDYGSMCERVKESEKALELFNIALDINVRLHGLSDLNTILALENVFTSQLSINIDDALGTGMKILQLASENPEANDRLDIFYGYVGTVLCEKKDYAAAFPYFENALNHLQSTKNIPPVHRMVTALCNIGSVHYRREEWLAAREYYVTALELSVRERGIHHPDSIQISEFVAKVDQNLIANEDASASGVGSSGQ